MKRFVWITLFVCSLNVWANSGDGCGVCGNKQNQNINDLKKISNISSLSSEAIAMIQRLEKQGFVCTNQQDADRSVQCLGKVLDYPEKVRIYIPRNFKPTQRSVSANYFFHGFRSAQTFAINKNDTQNPSDFAAIYHEANNAESLLIIPESQGKCETYFKFNQEGYFKKFNEEIAKLTEQKIDTFKLSGHSGAYRVLDNLTKKSDIKNQIRKILFLDSVYSDLPGVRNWLQESSQRRIKIAYVTGAEQSTVAATEKFLNQSAAVTGQIEILKLPTRPGGGSHMDAIRSGGLVDHLRP